MDDTAKAYSEIIDVVVDSAEKLAGAASLLKMLEDKADRGTVTAAELAAVRCTVESCAAALDAAWQEA